MIKAVLLDLDDTLIETNTPVFFPAYLQSLERYIERAAPSNAFIQHVMESFQAALNNQDPRSPLSIRLMCYLAERVGKSEEELTALFSTYYSHHYSELRHLVRPRRESSALLDMLFGNGFKVVVATNPGIPESAILQRMDWGGLSTTDYPFHLITTLETMHFGKPQAEYYQEILFRLDVGADEALVVGDDWENDIVGAAAVGLSTYWVTDQGLPPPDPTIPIRGHGSYQEFVLLAKTGWLDTVEPVQPGRTALLHRLRAFPAAIDTLRRTYSEGILNCAPAEHEWSARDIVCHLRDHEAEEDRARLRRIVAEDNPFLSANYDPWAGAAAYTSVTADQAFEGFAHRRAATVAWLQSLPPEAWARPARYAIFGPTHFEEMVRFMTEHDVTHLRQMTDAIHHALSVCE